MRNLNVSLFITQRMWLKRKENSKVLIFLYYWNILPRKKNIKRYLSWVVITERKVSPALRFFSRLPGARWRIYARQYSCATRGTDVITELSNQVPVEQQFCRELRGALRSLFIKRPARWFTRLKKSSALLQIFSTYFYTSLNKYLNLW